MVSKLFQIDAALLVSIFVLSPSEARSLVACSCLVFQYINENFVDEKHCIINLLIAKLSLIY